MRVNLKKSLIVAAAAASLSGAVASADPLVNLQILASSTQNGTYTNNLTVTPGETVFYEVVGQLAPVNTADNGHTITSLTAHPNSTTVNYDGINSLSFNLAEGGTLGGSFSSATLSGSPDHFAGGPGPVNGTVNGNSVTGVRAIQAAGIYAGALASTTILTGQFVVDPSADTGLTGTVTGSFGGTSSGFEINAPANGSIDSLGNKITINSTTEGGATPYVSYAPLTLSTAVPEPASIGLIGVAAMAMTTRRARRRQA